MKNKLLFLLLSLIYIGLFVYDIIKCSYIFIFPLIFEIFIIILKLYKKNYKTSKILEKIKHILLFLTLIIGLVYTKTIFDDVYIKVLLSFTIILEVLVFVKINNTFNIKKVR